MNDDQTNAGQDMNTGDNMDAAPVDPNAPKKEETEEMDKPVEDAA